MSSEVDERDGIAFGSFYAVAKGITVVCAASNDGPQLSQHRTELPGSQLWRRALLIGPFLRPLH